MRQSLYAAGRSIHQTNAHEKRALIIGRFFMSK
jgi:hypothetical protein